MLVKIEEIQGAGLELTEEVDRAVLERALGDSEGFTLKGATSLKARFKKVSGQVHVAGDVKVTVAASCKRCLKEQSIEVPLRFSLRMVAQAPSAEPEGPDGPGGKGRRPKGRQSKKDDGEAELAASFELDEVDVEPFDGKTIDLDPIVREQLLLALPVTVLCQEGCRGLCPRCGQDLNERDCGHAGEKEVDVRLAKLKEIKLKN